MMKKYKNVQSIQEIYEHALNNKTSLYRTYIEPIYEQLVDLFGEDYKNSEKLYRYAKHLERENEFYSQEDLLKIKINVALRKMAEIHKYQEEQRKIYEDFKKSQNIYKDQSKSSH